MGGRRRGALAPRPCGPARPAAATPPARHALRPARPRHGRGAHGNRPQRSVGRLRQAPAQPAIASDVIRPQSPCGSRGRRLPPAPPCRPHRPGARTALAIFLSHRPTVAGHAAIPPAARHSTNCRAVPWSRRTRASTRSSHLTATATCSRTSSMIAATKPADGSDFRHSLRRGEVLGRPRSSNWQAWSRVEPQQVSGARATSSRGARSLRVSLGTAKTGIVSSTSSTQRRPGRGLARGHEVELRRRLPPRSDRARPRRVRATPCRRGSSTH